MHSLLEGNEITISSGGKERKLSFFSVLKFTGLIFYTSRSFQMFVSLLFFVEIAA